MGVELSILYKEICTDYEMKLLTEGFFHKEIGWIHMMESPEFGYLLHGGELIFNSQLNYAEKDKMQLYIEELVIRHAGGLIVAMEQAESFPKELITYCNQNKFPVIWAAWETSYVEVMRRFSEILLSQERNTTNLIASFKNAVFYPKDEDRYCKDFERNGYSRKQSYVVVVIEDKKEKALDKLLQIEKSLRYLYKKLISYEEDDRLIILISEYNVERIRKEFEKICARDKNILAGIGDAERGIERIASSYQKAIAAIRVLETSPIEQLLCYGEMGIYQLLQDVEHKEVNARFLDDVLGNLIRYDEKNGTDYVRILATFMRNESSILHTAKALYCHKNTLYYKMDAIKKILGFDIMSNENRMRIMVAYYLLNLSRL